MGLQWAGRSSTQVGCREACWVASGLLAAGGRSVLWGRRIGQPGDPAGLCSNSPLGPLTGVQ